MSIMMQRMVVAQIEDMLDDKFKNLEGAHMVVRNDSVDFDIPQFYGFVFRTSSINGDSNIGIDVCITTFLDEKFVQFATPREKPIDRVVRIFTATDDEVSTRKKLESEFQKLTLDMHERLHDLFHNMYKLLKT